MISATTRRDWARSTRATLGVTWYAQDALGDVVFCELPEVGSTVRGSYAEVESVKAVSDVIAPAFGRGQRRQRGPGRQPRADQRDHGAGWLVRITIADPSRLPAGCRGLGKLVEEG